MTEILFPLLWIGGWIAASIWFRRANGKPINPKRPLVTAFCADWCSGRSLRNVLTRIGGARNCLLVYVSDDQLIVTPRFPFTLMFLPEIYGLDLTTPVASIASVEPVQHFGGRALRVSFCLGGPAPIELKLHDERRFLDVLGRQASAGGNRAIAAPDKPRGRYRLLFFRLFLAVWGSGALAAALSQLPEDYRFRQKGIETIGLFDAHTGVIGDQNDRGVLSYSVDGRRYHLTSLQGNGIYKLGSTAKLFYLPDKPDNAREAAYLYFDLVWLFLGTVALALSIFGGRIAKRMWH